MEHLPTGHAVGADELPLKQSAIFVHAIDFTAFDFDAGVGVGEPATVGANIVAGEPRGRLRRCGRDESDAQSERQARPANGDGYEATRDLHLYPHVMGSTGKAYKVDRRLARGRTLG